MADPGGPVPGRDPPDLCRPAARATERQRQARRRGRRLPRLAAQARQTVGRTGAVLAWRQQYAACAGAASAGADANRVRLDGQARAGTNAPSSAGWGCLHASMNALSTGSGAIVGSVTMNPTPGAAPLTLSFRPSSRPDPASKLRDHRHRRRGSSPGTARGFDPHRQTHHRR
jgi:hypothetical protein